MTQDTSAEAVGRYNPATYEDWRGMCGGISAVMELHESGRYVRLEDYLALASQLSAALEAQKAAEAKLAEALVALENIATHRKKCWDYDDDAGHQRREFDAEDVKIMEWQAKATITKLKGEA